MAKTWIETTRDDKAMIRRSHISAVYVITGKNESTKHEDKFYYFVKAEVRGDTFTISGPYNTKAEAIKWMKENFK